MFLSRLCGRYVLLSTLLTAIAALSSGCMWGVVTDATTGAPIVGAKVTLTDSRGQSLKGMTDGQGVFNLSPSDLTSLSDGQAGIKAGATGYGTVSRTFYLQNPVATSWNPLSFELLRGSFVYWHDKVTHLSLLFPAGWAITSFDNVTGGGASAPHPDDKDTFCAMVPSPMIGNSLESTMERLLTLMGMSGYIQRAGLVSTTVKGLPAVKTTISYKASSDSANRAKAASPEDLIYAIGLNDKVAYFISCDTPSTKYGEWEPKFEAIVHSLETGK